MLERITQPTGIAVTGGNRYSPERLPRATARALAAVEQRTLVRLATVQGEGMVQAEKLHEIDHLARVAMTGQAMLHRWGATLAADDPFIADDLRFFQNLARIGKGEILADTIDSFCRESRR